MSCYVYILANVTNTTIYVGITNDLVRRLYEHRHKLDAGSFTAKYDIHKLVYYEYTGDVRAAIEREKQIKSWNRAERISWQRVGILDGKIYMNRYFSRRKRIATPVCGLVRNDILFDTLCICFSLQFQRKELL